MSEPDLYTYLDFRQYLSDWFDARKASDASFSHRQFARLADQKSPSLLLSVIQRKRNLTPAATIAFARGMALSPDQTIYFLALVDLDQAQTDEARAEAYARVSAERRFRGARQLDGDAFVYLSTWYLPAMRELAGADGFQADAAWIARTLRPSITEDQAREGLELLLRLGLLARGGDGVVRQTDVSVVTPREVGTLAVLNYHRDMSERARIAVGTVDPVDRHFLGLTVAISRDMIPALKEQLNALQARLLDMCDSAESSKRRVVQVNLHLFPLSEDV